MATTTQALAKRLGKNLGGYFGDAIDIGAVLADIRQLAMEHGWSVEPLPTEPGFDLITLFRPNAEARRLGQTTQYEMRDTSPLRLYISTGIHGDEPAGPLAARELLQRNQWPDCADICFCPCLNPTGFPLNKRG